MATVDPSWLGSETVFIDTAEPIATLTDTNEYTNTNKFDVTLTKSDSDVGFF